MEWILNYLYIIIFVLGLITVMYLFGYRSKSTQDGNAHDHQSETDTGEKPHKGGHGCCH